MWLVKVTNQLWIDAEKLDSINVGTDGSTFFSLESTPTESFKVDDDLVSGFLNHVGAINNNHCCQIQDEVEKVIKLKLSTNS